MNASNKIVTLLGLSVLAPSLTVCNAQDKPKRPNIIFIMSDDHAYQAVSAYGDRFASVAPTPNIDRIAKKRHDFQQVSGYQFNLRTFTGLPF